MFITVFYRPQKVVNIFSKFKTKASIGTASHSFPATVHAPPPLTELHPHRSFSLFFFILYQIPFAIMISLLKSATITVHLLEQLFTESWLKKQAESVLSHKLSGRSALGYNWSACHTLGFSCQVCFGFLERDLLMHYSCSFLHKLYARYSAPWVNVKHLVLRKELNCLPVVALKNWCLRLVRHS